MNNVSKCRNNWDHHENHDNCDSRVATFFVCHIMQGFILPRSIISLFGTTCGTWFWSIGLVRFIKLVFDSLIFPCLSGLSFQNAHSSKILCKDMELISIEPIWLFKFNELFQSHSTLDVLDIVLIQVKSFELCIPVCHLYLLVFFLFQLPGNFLPIIFTHLHFTCISILILVFFLELLFGFTILNRLFNLFLAFSLFFSLLD